MRRLQRALTYWPVWVEVSHIFHVIAHEYEFIPCTECGAALSIQKLFLSLFFSSVSFRSFWFSNHNLSTLKRCCGKVFEISIHIVVRICKCHFNGSWILKRLQFYSFNRRRKSFLFTNVDRTISSGKTFAGSSLCEMENHGKLFTLHIQPNEFAFEKSQTTISKLMPTWHNQNCVCIWKCSVYLFILWVRCVRVIILHFIDRWEKFISFVCFCRFWAK